MGSIGAASARGNCSLTVVMEKDGAAVAGGSLTLYPVKGMLVDDPCSPAAVEQMVQYVQKFHVEGRTQTVARDGTVLFDELEEGLYLIVQHEATPGYLPINSFAVYVPQGGLTQAARPKISEDDESGTPQTGDTGQTALWLLLMGGSLTGIGVCIVGVKKHRRTR